MENMKIDIDIVKSRSDAKIWKLQKLRTISGTKPSSGLGVDRSNRMLWSATETFKEGFHCPFGGKTKVSRQILPPSSTFGWYIFVTNIIFGGSMGYLGPSTTRQNEKFDLCQLRKEIVPVRDNDIYFEVSFLIGGTFWTQNYCREGKHVNNSRSFFEEKLFWPETLRESGPDPRTRNVPKWMEILNRKCLKDVIRLGEENGPASSSVILSPFGQQLIPGGGSVSSIWISFRMRETRICCMVQGSLLAFEMRALERDNIDDNLPFKGSGMSVTIEGPGPRFRKVRVTAPSPNYSK
jgi:hypothetical protein